MECQCEKHTPEDAGWWMNANSVQMGAFTVVGYLLYRFSQTLPALIRWPIRLFCSLTGLSALWGWISRLVGTLQGIQSLFKWLSRIWRFLASFSSKFKWIAAVIKAVTDLFRNGSLESQIDPTISSLLNQMCDPSGSSIPKTPGLRLILLGPAGAGRTSLADTIMNNSERRTTKGPLKMSTMQRAVVDGRELTVIETPDLLGTSLGNKKKAMEILRSVQLASPGPHAFLLVLRAPGSTTDQDAVQAVRATLELFGVEVLEYVIPVLTHADRLGRRLTVDQLLDADAGSLKRAVSLCGQRPELVDSRPDRPPEERSVTCRQLVEHVSEIKELRGHFVHELQRREDRIRAELLADMTSALARKLGNM
ncbi:GTPase IMAP family member 6-like [Archocentrus centrarchus]|uniref:GTPase IMAP family member 6-like n=1 Tax=Archocentrus centrarchus TaxID=63155 RepID=UPI0011EA204D|nr:GTPase IMAP family member 6-like [Archocentrus centrarchus]